MDLPPYITRDVGIDGAPGYDFPELIKLLTDFSLWLDRVGINTSNTRLVRYITFLEDWLKQPFSWPEIEPDDDELVPLPDEIVKLLYTMKEVHEFIWIYNSFKDKLPPGSEALLRIMIGGKDFARDDVDTRARNHQFQLRIASYFVSGNYEVDLSGQADVIARLSRNDFFIECKRLYSNKKVNARIKEAAAQLSKRSRNKKLFTKNFCIAAFDVTNIAFPQEGSIWGWNYKHCCDALQKKLIEIGNKYDFTGPFEANKNMILVWLQIHIGSLSILQGDPGTRFSSLFIPLAPKAGYRAETFERLKQVIELQPDGSLPTGGYRPLTMPF